MRTLVAIVGSRNLSDFSVGPVLLDSLRKMAWDSGVEIEDMSYGPIAVVQNLEDRPRYDRMVFLSAVKRGRVAGDVYRREFKQLLPHADEIQARIREAVTGVIDLDNLLIVVQHFGFLAPEVVSIEVEPLECESGEALSPAVSAIVPDILRMIEVEAHAGVNYSAAR